MMSSELSSWPLRFLDTVESNSEWLGSLDRAAGDGDFGSNMDLAAKKSRAALLDDLDLGPAFACLAKGFGSVGGTSGPLLSSLFRAVARNVKACSDPGSMPEALTSGFGEGLRAIQSLGSAEPGDRTLVDALSPAVDAMRALPRGRSIRTVLEAAAVAARSGAEATREMIAARGRASYLGEVVLDVPDPGAMLIALLFESALDEPH